MGRSLTVASTLLVVAFGLLSPTILAWTAQPGSMDPVAVLDARQDAENAGDVDAALDTFADDAVVRIGVGSPMERQFIGKEEIRGWLEGLIHVQQAAVESGQPRQVHHGNVVTWTSWVSLDPWRQLGIASLEFWGVALVHDGKIKMLANGPTPESAATLRAAQRPPTRP